jgi:acetylglutamate kinase
MDNKTQTLKEALPYLREFYGEYFVIKLGGSIMSSDKAITKFAEDIVLLKKVGINPIIVHGGGPNINIMLEKLNIKSSFIDGLRVTCKDAVDIVEMVLCGSINKNLVKKIQSAGGIAVGLSGKDGGMIKAKKATKTKKDPNSNIEKILDLGFVGEPTEINPDVLMIFENTEVIPVISPVGYGDNYETFNINADTVAGALAASVGASKLIILSDVAGVKDKNGDLISKLNSNEARRMISNGDINGGMIPKVENCLEALSKGVEYVHILDGSIENVILIEIFTKTGVGTMIEL